jgi:mannose-6-phosphate isomerase-like protein (cupin superfamily)
METDAMAGGLVVDREAIAVLPVAPIGDLRGVERKVLWRGGDSEAGILVVFGGHQLGAHTHRSNHHHLWVLDGRAVILGAEVGSGSFVHVPSGVEHDIDARRTSGCAVFYVYAPSGG